MHILYRCSHFVSAGEATPTHPHPQVQTDTSGFEKIIRDILEVGQHPPILRFLLNSAFLVTSHQFLSLFLSLLPVSLKAKSSHKRNVLTSCVAPFKPYEASIFYFRGKQRQKFNTGQD